MITPALAMRFNLSAALIVFAAAAGKASAQSASSPASTGASESNRQAISTALGQVQKAQELFRGRQRIYARSLGQLGDNVTIADSVIVSLSAVSATGYVATGRHLGSPAIECTLVVGDAPLPVGIAAREIGRPVCITKKSPE